MRGFLVSIFFTIQLLAVSMAYGQGVNVGGPAKESPMLKNLRLAQEYYGREEYEKALKYLDEVPDEIKSMGAIYELKLGCYLELLQYDEAEKLVKSYVKKGHGNNANYQADLLMIYQKQQKQSKADKLVEEVLEEVEERPAMAHSYANAFQKKGYPQIALAVYEAGERQMPNANYDYQKALLYGELGDIKKMYGMYVEMVERTPNYLSTVKQLLGRALREETTTENSEYLKTLLIQKIQDGAPETMNELLIFVFIQEKNFSGAFLQLKALDRRTPTNKAGIYSLGNVALNNEEYSLAIRIFDYVIKAGDKYPFYEQALTGKLKAQSLKLEEDGVTEIAGWKELQKEYFKTIETLKGLPDVGPLTIDMAHLTAFKLNETDTAAGMLRKLISTGFISKEDIARAKIELGDILLYNGDRWEAILLYGQAEKAFEQSPIGQEAKFKRAKAAYYVGDFLWAQGIFDALKASTSKLIANDAMRYSLLINDNIALDTNMEAMQMYAKADLMNYQGKRDSALRLLDMMEIAFPGHGIQDEVLFLKAQILVDQKKYDEAASAYQQLVDLYAKDILADDAMYALADLYFEKLNKRTEAMNLYQKIFTDHPDSFFAPDARKKYREMRGDAVIN